MSAVPPDLLPSSLLSAIKPCPLTWGCRRTYLFPFRLQLGSVIHTVSFLQGFHSLLLTGSEPPCYFSSSMPLENTIPYFRNTCQLLITEKCRFLHGFYNRIPQCFNAYSIPSSSTVSVSKSATSSTTALCFPMIVACPAAFSIV